jgi:hypothetical protein
MHLMVTHHTADIIKLVDRLVLAAPASSSLSPKPSSARSALDVLVWWRAMEYTIWSPTSIDTWYLARLTPMS